MIFGLPPKLPYLFVTPKMHHPIFVIGYMNGDWKRNVVFMYKGFAFSVS